MKSPMIIDWTVQTIVHFPWRRIDFEFEDRSFRYIQQSRELASVLRTHANASLEDQNKAFQSISRVLSGLSWTLKVPMFSDLHGGCGALGPFKDMKQRIPTVVSKAMFLQTYHVSSFSLPIVPNDKAWKALAYHREALSANSAFHKAISYFKAIEVALPKKKQRENWISKHYEETAPPSQKPLLSILRPSPRKFFAEDVGHHAVAHQLWLPDKLPDYTLGHVAARILENLAIQAIRDELGVCKSRLIRRKR